MRLNIGSGGTELPGFDSWDIKNGKPADKLPFPDDSVEEIYASHILEHFGHKQTLSILKEWCRVLQPGGRIRISVPDIDKVIQKYTSGDPIWAEGILFGGQIDEHDFHKAAFNESKLRQLLDHCNLENIERFEAEIKDCASLPISLNLQGVKAKGPPLILPRRVERKRLTDTHACITMPRVCWTDTAFIIQPICARLGIAITRSTGVFWEQKITAAIVDALKRGAKYILTFDYDSIMDDETVIALHDIMEANPDVSALFPLQTKREEGHVMVSLRDQKLQVEFAELRAADIYPASTGHFGCTFIRSDVFSKIEKPWFHSEPAADGTWGESHTDADINFWRQLDKVGLKACLAPHISVGHAEVMIAWPRKQDWATLYEHVTDYDKKGKPEDAV